jgi:hypothetical protein
MKRICKILGIAMLALAIGFSMAACRDGFFDFDSIFGGNDDDSHGIDTSVQGVEQLPSFGEVSFVQDQNEAMELFFLALMGIMALLEEVEEMELIAGPGGYAGGPSLMPPLLPGFSTVSPSMPRSIMRNITPIFSTQSGYESFQETIDERIDGLGSIKGFIEMTDEYRETDPYGAAGDFFHTRGNFVMRLELDVDEVDAFLYGAFVFDGNMDVRTEFISYDPSTGDGSSRARINSLGINAGSAFSVSDGQKGMKFVLKFSANANNIEFIVTNDEDDEEDMEELMDLLANNVSLEINVYDNSNARHFIFTLDDLLESIFDAIDE